MVTYVRMTNNAMAPHTQGCVFVILLLSLSFGSVSLSSSCDFSLVVMLPDLWIASCLVFFWFGQFENIVGNCVWVGLSSQVLSFDFLVSEVIILSQLSWQIQNGQTLVSVANSKLFFERRVPRLRWLLFTPTNFYLSTKVRNIFWLRMNVKSCR